ncbi:DUF4235 domain-containing protein [Aquihabitans sp. G128]|uniref:DUF4235 domain-containing protein n=1 Tax=Aquihabitans sp. G128 TaxID=2849779 RepID=UPI001C238B01|nr:DUF4235 domain-containing protein [Aquihabitans sp. G128]QXC59574.1 DUF4235 domain-containing protein [Aquihabitans sp. G128]
MADNEDDLIWTLATTGAAIAAASVAKKALTKGWVKRKGKVPGNPAGGDTTWAEALAWALVSGIGVGLARLFAQRGVAFAFDRVRGGLPEKANTKATA